MVTSVSSGPDFQVRVNLEKLVKLYSEQMEPLLKAIANATDAMSKLNEAQLRSQKRLERLTWAIVGLTIVIAVTAILRL